MGNFVNFFWPSQKRILNFNCHRRFYLVKRRQRGGGQKSPILRRHGLWTAPNLSKFLITFLNKRDFFKIIIQVVDKQFLNYYVIHTSIFLLMLVLWKQIMLLNHDLFPHFVDVSSHGLPSVLFMLLLIRPYGSFLVSNWSISDHPYTYYVSIFLKLF